MLLRLLKRLRPTRAASAGSLREHADMARTHIAHKRFALAAERLAILSRIEPANAAWPAAQADCLASAGDLEGAARCLEAALALAPGDARLWTKLGYAHWELALVDEAISAYRRAVECDPAAEPAGGNLLFALLHREESPATCLQEARRWARVAIRNDAPRCISFDNSPAPERRLRIGYVSADLRTHAMAPFVEAMLAFHDRRGFEVVCYDGTRHSDEYSARLQSYETQWRATAQLDDTAFGAMVREDRIDILVDLSGHTGGNRLRAFAAGLAPIQVCNHGYPATTGLECFDWRLTDAANDPPGLAERFYSEPLYRLPDFSFCYRPAAPRPVSREPGGAFTFASLNNVRKITPRIVTLWSAILKRAPGARLLIAGTPPGPARERILAQLVQAGIAPERLETQGWLAQRSYAQLHGRIDVALDTYPYNGSTTTFEALHHGVPVVTLSGTVFVSRHGRATLEALGAERFAADTDDGYIDAAASLAARPEEIPRLRSELHERMARSSIMDGRGYVARLEAAYRDMWQRWCARSI